MRTTLLLACLMFAQPASAAPKWLKTIGKVAGHMAIGGGVSLAVNEAAGGGNKWAPGLAASTAVAVFKEYADHHDKKDSFWMAVEHGLEIDAGAGVEIAIQQEVNEHHYYRDVTHCADGCRVGPWRAK